MSFHSIAPLNPVEVLIKLNHSTLVIPTVSVGNIPQLATDLLIHNFECTKVAHLDDEFLYPFISPVDYVEDGQEKAHEPCTGFNTALEVYHNEALQLTVLQQRSPVLPGLQKKFVQELLVPFIQNVGFDRLIVLNSVTPNSGSVGNRIFCYTNSLTDAFQSLTTQNDSVYSKVEDLHRFKSQLLNSLQASIFAPASSSSMHETPSELNLSRQLKEKFPNSLPLSRNNTGEQTIPSENAFTVLSVESYEGDNTQDAIRLTQTVLSLLAADSKMSLKQPKSWSGFYGTKEIPVGIEGLYS